jgi:hypothetical protein
MFTQNFVSLLFNAFAYLLLYVCFTDISTNTAISKASILLFDPFECIFFFNFMPCCFPTQYSHVQLVFRFNNPNWLQTLQTMLAQRQNPSVVGGEAQVSVLKPGSDTMCKILANRS